MENAMTPRLRLHDPQDSSDCLDNWGNEVESFALKLSALSLRSSSADVLSPSGSPPVTAVVVPAEAAEAQAAVSGSGSGGVGSVVAETSGGLTINLIFDAAAMAAPASFRAGIAQAASILSSAISDKITINLDIDYSGTGGGAAAGPDNGQYLSYASVRADLINNATPGDTAFNSLPTGSSIQGQSQVAVWNAQLKLWGLIGANDTTTDDGSATFATDINPNLLVGVALHELTHAMGRVPYGPQPDVFDFDRFTSVGTRLLANGDTAPAAYFSLNGGTTKLADYGQTSDPSDFLNSGVQGPNDPFNEFYTGSTLQTLTAVDLEQLDALGFHTASLGLGITPTSSRAVQGGPAIALLSATPTISNAVASVLTSATIKIANASGNPVAGDELYVNGQQGGSVDGGLVAVSWNDVSKILTLTGNASLTDYQTLLSGISYQDSGTDASTGSHPQRSVTWTINDGAASGGTASQVTIDRPPVVTVANISVNATTPVASLFAASDPDGDAIATYAFKDSGNGHFLLNGVAQPNNQEIDVTAAQLAQLTYQSTGGTDTVQVRLSDGTAWGSWQSFTVTGPASTVIEAFGSTKLVQIGTNFCLDSISTGSGPQLKYSASAVTPGEFGTWTPIGAEQTASGYDVAWKDPASGMYTVWSTDANGNYVSNIVSACPGSSTALEAIETTFHQDLNGDGVIGLPPLPTTTLESSGSTSLVEVATTFYLDSISTGSGPQLKYSASAVTPGEFGTWAPIGAEQTASGYDVAWKDPASGMYTVWSTDANGNYVSNIVSACPGSSTALEAIETTFHQDLNGDGVIGIPAGTHPVATQLADLGPSGFDGTTLTINASSAANSEIIGFTGHGTAAGLDKIDLQGFNFNFLHSGFDGSTGLLKLTDGSNSAQLQFLGSYSQENFQFADDGSGGTLVYASSPSHPDAPIAQTAGPNQASLATLTGHDIFVFGPNFGQVSISNFVAQQDSIHFNKAVFADINAVIAAVHVDASGNAVITATALDTITFQHVTTAQLLAAQNSFHLF
jgi:serralysin